ncbi:MAG: D-aminoacylase [Planctomycetales bacterium]|nr:D-aminoacylase [Planctomycetales bacterium]
MLIVNTTQAEFCWAQDKVDADVLLTGGLLYVGDGQIPIHGDVAIRGDRIVAVGEFDTGQVLQSIDCSKLMISPGFIDLHNHSDDEVLENDTRAVMNYLTQGCTTIVTGNCGSGPVDAGSYLKKVDELGAGVNVAHLIPQGSLREQVMGTEQRVASDEELASMRQLAEEAMLAGTWGMSSGLIYVPSSYADESELAAIAEIVGKHGGIYASHIRGEGTGLLDSVAEAISIGRRAKLPVHISHFKSSGKDSWGLVRIAAAEIDRARAAGATITADQYPYTASSTSLAATVIPPWARAGGDKKMLARFDDPVDGPKIRAAVLDKLELTDDGGRIQIAQYQPNPQWVGLRVLSIAQQENAKPIDIVLQILREGGAQIVNHSINEEDVRYVMQRPWVATASDGSSKIPSSTVPHPRSYGTFPRKIGHYAIGEETVSLEHAVRSSSGLPADILGLSDRGYLRVGYAADIAVWDPETIIDTATFEQPHRYSRGMKYVFVNGVPAIVDGAATGALAGRALRHSSPKL